MKTHISSIILLILTVSLGALSSVGIYESAFIFPKYFSSPPASFQLLKEHIDVTAPYFWIPLQSLSLVLFITNLILNWKDKQQRKLLLIAFFCYQFVNILSIAYFVPQVNGFMEMPPTGPASPELIEKAQNWLRYSWSRQALLFVSFIIVLLAFGKQRQGKGLV